LAQSIIGQQLTSARKKLSLRFLPQKERGRCLPSKEGKWSAGNFFPSQSRQQLIEQETHKMKKQNNSARAQRVVRRLFSNYRILPMVVFSACALLWACAPASYTNDASTGYAAGVQTSFAGQWLIEFKTGEEKVQISLRYQRESKNGFGFSNNSFDIAPGELQGLTREQAMSSAGGRVQFQLRRDAGTFNCEGWFKDGNGSGHFVFSPNPAYSAELKKQGYGAPSAEQQFSMALHDVSLAFIEELKSQGYERPTLDQLVTMGEHGVRLEYVQGLKALGYMLRSIDSLIEMRDHGVTLNFIRELAALGYERIPADELVRTRDHGVTPEFIKWLREAGYDKLTLPRLIEMRDHGISPKFAKELEELGYARLSVDQLIEMRDHGVSANFIQELKQFGYERVPVEQLIRLRDHGVSTSFIQKMKARGRNNLSIEELIELRDRGGEEE
jgi:hypothetical protein